MLRIDTSLFVVLFVLKVELVPFSPQLETSPAFLRNVLELNRFSDFTDFGTFSFPAILSAVPTKPFAVLSQS